MDLAVRFSQNPSDSNCYRVWLAYFASTLNCLAQTLDCPSPRDFPYIIQSRYFTYLPSLYLWGPWLLAWKPSLSSLPSLCPFLHMAKSGRIHYELFQMSLPMAIIFHISIINFFLCHAEEELCSFSFIFIFFIQL